VRVAPERLLALGAAAVGAISVVSALTPEMADRFDLVRGVLPPGVPEAARLLALAFGMALLWLSRSLALRRRSAWRLAVVLVVGVTAAHLAKGLDFEEASSAVVLLAALLRYRGRFTVPGDPAASRLAALYTLAALLAGGVWLLRPESDHLEDVLGTLGVLLALRALQLWLRPLSEIVRQSREDRAAVRAIVEAYGRDSLAFFALRRDKSWFFSPTRRSFLAYRVVGAVALVSGDPVGDEAEFDALIAEFLRVAHARGRRIAVLGADDAGVERYRRFGLRAIKLGEEGVVRPHAFSLDGRAIRKVRQSVHRLERAGYRSLIVSARELDERLRAELDAVSREWLGAAAERGFAMAMDDLYADPDIVFAVAEDSAGRAQGFLHLVPAPATQTLSLSTMRRRRNTPNGLMEFLIVRAIEWARDARVQELSLNFCVFTDVLRGGGMLRALVVRFDRLFQLERLFAFTRKFHPDWRPRYVCVERYADVPAVALAWLRLESLLTPPRPWRRPEQVSH
jgi:lysyl-tRNA synthetase class 2